MRQIHKTDVPKNTYPLRQGASFCPILVSFHIQITYRKVRNLQIGVNKLVGKVPIKLLRLSKSAICIISIIFDAPAIAYTVVIVHVVHLNKYVDLTSIFVTIAVIIWCLF